MSSIHLARAENSLRTLLACVGLPGVDRDDPSVVVAISDLLASEPAAVHTALRRLVIATAASSAHEQGYRLTKRETDVAQLLALGKSNSEIAEALSISEHTCRHHTERVLAKMGVRSRAAVGARLRETREPSLAAS